MDDLREAVPGLEEGALSCVAEGVLSCVDVYKQY